MQAIVLCGGLGTRLRDALPEGTPKAMADVHGRPFLWHLLAYWAPFIDTFVLATGYGHQKTYDYFHKSFWGKKIIYAESLKGTRGAVEWALKSATEFPILILNGDTFFEVNPLTLFQFNTNHGGDITLSYSLRDNCHAGVDILNNNLGAYRASIFPCDDYFIDIGTPAGLNAFRQRVKCQGLALPASDRNAPSPQPLPQLDPPGGC